MHYIENFSVTKDITRQNVSTKYQIDIRFRVMLWCMSTTSTITGTCSAKFLTDIFVIVTLTFLSNFLLCSMLYVLAFR